MHFIKKMKLGLLYLTILTVSLGINKHVLADTESNSQIDLTPCYIENLPDRLLCGSIKQPLSYETNEGEIEIHFAVIPAIKKSHPTEAILGFAGGPGQSAVELAAIFNRNLRYARENRDILLVDQRGTGKSLKLQCQSDDLVTLFAFNDALIDMNTLATEDTQRCKSEIKVDLSHFTTPVAAKDFEAVRKALGYTGLHLYGVSYGTRIAQEYTRQFPDSVLTSTLDGVAPMQQGLSAIGHAIDMSLDALLKRCTTDVQCEKQYPKLSEQLVNLLDRLDRSPVTIDVRHPRTHQKTELVVTQLKFFSAIRMALYSHHTRALIPLTISEALAGNYSPLVGLLSSSDMVDSMAMGMHSAIVCGEDWPFLTATSREKDMQSYFGKLMIESLDISCPIWQVKPVDSRFYQPLNTTTPTLLLSGGVDPATPPEWAEMAMVNMKNATHLIAPSATHGVVSQTCAAKLVGQFIDKKSVQELDVSCLEKDNRKQFFMNLNGTVSTQKTKISTVELGGDL
ncbi:alpha/beta fold hydrolase [Pseudoalteromonas aurantia]|uniref:Alpha/beta hydrolase n=1 Tax=Pseudoalteromonas aurantia TaxID=43654 RepID=A0A5S3VD51_9GAMM|nr:alpha/beta fold hydrolase [Pseudoalteromonas aurantia]TMO69556.1 alpha/beta hydrolase [Pseudoalteromonas aurantia]TMO74344.1 alpha/beta hydrolase [Pseudoalteromonas aurantia]